MFRAIQMCLELNGAAHNTELVNVIFPYTQCVRYYVWLCLHDPAAALRARKYHYNNISVYLFYYVHKDKIYYVKTFKNISDMHIRM